jgi:uridine phosphorylase
VLLDDHGRAYHLDLAAGEVGRYVLLPGDPGRVEPLASRLDGARRLAERREYLTWVGELDGTPVAVTSTGIGCPSAAIAVEELAGAGADTFIRVGQAGGMQAHTPSGDLVVASAAVRDEGTTRHYVPGAFPAVADLDVTLALRDGLRRAGFRHHVGVVQSKDSFYGQRSRERMPVAEELQARWQAWIRAGALCSEMEAAAIFIVASVLRKRAGAILLVAGNQEIDPEGKHRDDAKLDTLLDGAIAGLRTLIARDLAQQQV